MSVFLIILLICASIMYLLFMELILYIDTGTNEYYIQAKGLMKAKIEPHKEELLRIRIQTLFMNFYFYPLKKIGASKKPRATKKLRVKSKSRIGFRKGLQILRTFRVERLLLDFDAGNCIVNAKLYPLFAFLNHNIGDFRINFEGRNQFILQMQNRPIRIIKSIINIKT